MTNPTTAATDGTARPRRHRGIVRLDEGLLHQLIVLPEGQRIIGLRDDTLRLCIDVHVEGDGLPEVAEACEAPLVDPNPYAARFSVWALRGAELEDKLRALVDEYLPGDNALADYIRDVLDLRHVEAAES